MRPRYVGVAGGTKLSTLTTRPKVAESNSRVKKEEPCGSLRVDAASDALEMHLLGLVDGLRSPLQRALDLFWSFVPLQDAE
jgi:hypothetical protein